MRLQLKLFQLTSLYSPVGHRGVVNQSLPAGLGSDTCALGFNCSLFMIRTGGSCVKDMFQRWESCRQSKRSRLNPRSSRVCCVWQTKTQKVQHRGEGIFSHAGMFLLEQHGYTAWLCWLVKRIQICTTHLPRTDFSRTRFACRVVFYQTLSTLWREEGKTKCALFWEVGRNECKTKHSWREEMCDS